MKQFFLVTLIFRIVINLRLFPKHIYFLFSFKWERIKSSLNYFYYTFFDIPILFACLLTLPIEIILVKVVIKRVSYFN